MAFLEAVESISIIVASGTVAYGIGAWHREHIGRRRIELAEEVLSLFYGAADAINHIRSDFSFWVEGKSREESPDETPEEKEAKDRAFIPSERYQKHQETFSRLQALRYRFMALFGKEASRPFDELKRIETKILVAARTLDSLWAQAAAGNPVPRLEERVKKSEVIIWDDGSGEDPIQKQLRSLISEMEETCQAIISKKGWHEAAYSRAQDWLKKKWGTKSPRTM
jgi:hypothetical protein